METCKTLELSLKGVTDLLLLNCGFSPFAVKEMSVSTCNAVGLSSLVPEIDSLKVEFLEIVIVLESLVDLCVLC